MATPNWQGSILLSLPTFGYLHVGMFTNLQIQEVPIHRSIIWHLPVDMPVADARNQAAEKAIDQGCAYVYFRDYDVLAPPQALPMLMARDTDIVGGMYCSKQRPPWPLIIKDGCPTLDWDFGDLVKCDGIGMGCTLIKTELFERMDPPWFETLNVSELDKPLHRTATEDIRFCQRLKEELDVYPYADTAVSCVHINWDTRERYYFSPENQSFVWQPKDDDAKFIPSLAHPECRVADQSTPVQEEASEK